MIKRYDLILGLLALLALRCVHHSSISDALVLGVLGGLYAYRQFLDSKKEEPINDTLKVEIQDMKNTLNALKVSKSFR